MNSFDIDMSLRDEDVQWMIDIGDNITEPNWTIRPYKLSDKELSKLSYLWEGFVEPSYAAIIMTPANTICKTHVDDKAEKAGVKQRITAINIPLQVHQASLFQYMSGDTWTEMIKLNRPKCWRVDIPHRVDNSNSPFNRVVLSLSYTQTIDELYEIYCSTKH